MLFVMRYKRGLEDRDPIQDKYIFKLTLSELHITRSEVSSKLYSKTKQITNPADCQIKNVCVY